MTAPSLTLGLVVLLATGATMGPRLLGTSSLRFSTSPRVGMAVWCLAAAAWVGGLVLLGPMLSWTVSGPALPGPVGETCQRCLAAANPFGESTRWVLDVPVASLLVVPALLVTGIVTTTAVRLVRTHRGAAAHLRAVRATGELRHVACGPAWVLPTEALAAYSVPRRGGVVVSAGTVDALRADELTAVLAHERAHLRQRHRLLLDMLGALGTVLGLVPLLRAAGPAVAAYAEMAADDAARRAAGGASLARALLVLGAPRPVPATGGAPALPRRAGSEQPLLHAAAGPTVLRARRLLVAEPRPPGWWAALTAGYLAALVAVVAVVALPFASLALSPYC